MPTYDYKKFFHLWLPVLLYAGAIFTLSSFPISFPPGFKIHYLDKVLHAIEYGILGFLLARAFLKASPPYCQKSFQAWAVVIAICYGFTDEIQQLYVPTRETSSIDLLFDGVGAMIAQLFFERRGL